MQEDKKFKKKKKFIFDFFRNLMLPIRFQGDDMMLGQRVMPHAPRIPQMEMMKVHIPFTFKLHESFKSTYAGKFYNKYNFLLFLLCRIKQLIREDVY